MLTTLFWFSNDVCSQCEPRYYTAFQRGLRYQKRPQSTLVGTTLCRPTHMVLHVFPYACADRLRSRKFCCVQSLLTQPASCRFFRHAVNTSATRLRPLETSGLLCLLQAKIETFHNIGILVPDSNEPSERCTWFNNSINCRCVQVVESYPRLRGSTKYSATFISRTKSRPKVLNSQKGEPLETLLVPRRRLRIQPIFSSKRTARELFSNPLSCKVLHVYKRSTSLIEYAAKTDPFL
jgi:hypothetical protein